MPAVIRVIAGHMRSYGAALLLALVLHILLLLALWLTRFSPPVKPVTATAITSFLYQPTPAIKAEDIPPPPTDESIAAQVKPEVNSSDVSASEVATESAQKAVLPTAAKQDAAVQASAQSTAEHVIQLQPGLAERTLNRAATPSSAMIQQAADASYQQFLQAQQQPKITVEKQHQELSVDPAGQVLTQLDDGRQIIRTKDGCRIADPTKDGFESLMAARAVSCGDKASNAELLQQALEKHSKR